MLSGDHHSAVLWAANETNIKDWQAELSPEQKLQQVTTFQAAGQPVLMVGDGLNDAPVLAAANASIAISNGAAMSKINADLVMSHNRVGAISRVLVQARRTKSIIEQNLGWAIVYNLLALPAAAMGWVPPWMAAIGMSISSLVVVGNSLRLARPSQTPITS
jgi:Cu2+-exporting ATPase